MGDSWGLDVGDGWQLRVWRGRWVTAGSFWRGRWVSARSLKWEMGYVTAGGGGGGWRGRWWQWGVDVGDGWQLSTGGWDQWGTFNHAVIFFVWLSWQLPKTPFWNWGVGEWRYQTWCHIHHQIRGARLTSTDTGQQPNQHRHWVAAWPAQTLGSSLTSTDTGQRPAYQGVVRVEAADCPVVIPHAFPSCLMPSSPRVSHTTGWVVPFGLRCQGPCHGKRVMTCRIWSQWQWQGKRVMSCHVWSQWPWQGKWEMTCHVWSQWPWQGKKVVFGLGGCKKESVWWFHFLEIIGQSTKQCKRPENGSDSWHALRVWWNARPEIESDWWHVLRAWWNARPEIESDWWRVLRAWWNARPEIESDWWHVLRAWWNARPEIESDWWRVLRAWWNARPEIESDWWHVLRAWWNARPEIESDWWRVLRAWWNARSEIESIRGSDWEIPSVEQASEEKWRMTCVLSWKYQKHQDDARHTTTEVDTELQCRKRKWWSRVFNVASRGTGHVSDDLVTSCSQQSHYDQLNHNYQLKHFLNIFSDMCLGQFQAYDSCIPSTSMNCVTDYGTTLTDPICLMSPAWMTVRRGSPLETQSAWMT